MHRLEIDVIKYISLSSVIARKLYFQMLLLKNNACWVMSHLLQTNVITIKIVLCNRNDTQKKMQVNGYYFTDIKRQNLKIVMRSKILIYYFNFSLLFSQYIHIWNPRRVWAAKEPFPDSQIVTMQQQL